jgi:uncharacterized membrane protein
MQPWEEQLAKWRQAGVLDDAAAARIRALEAEEEKRTGLRREVLVALILGAILLVAGVALFLEAHWEEVSPGRLMFLVVGILAALHAAAIATSDRFPALGTALHGVGTIAAGGIAMFGQILFMQEHWPTAILLWGLCAAAGWYWLRDEFQEVCCLLLFPVWLICEFDYYAGLSRAGEVYLYRIVAVMAAVYLTSFVHSRRRLVFGVLFTVAGIGLLVAPLEIADGWRSFVPRDPGLPSGLRAAAIAMMLVIVAAGWLMDKKTLLPSSAVFAMVFALPWLTFGYGAAATGYGTGELRSVLAYMVLALVFALLAWWGVRESSRAVVNYAMLAFALTVAIFCGSDVMTEFGRSIGLIVMGVVVLAGGWGLERVRRRLVVKMSSGVPA